MSFSIDKQTISDLELFSDKDNVSSIFQYYDRTITRGGSIVLYKLFQSPFTDIEILETRKQEIVFFTSLDVVLELNRRQYEYIEYYLAIQRSPLRRHFLDAIRDSLSDKLKPTNDYYTIKEGIIHVLEVLSIVKTFLNKIDNSQIPYKPGEVFKSVRLFLEDDLLNKYIAEPPNSLKRLKPKIINRLDNFFRSKAKLQLRETLDMIYRIDVLQTMASLVATKGFSIPEYIDGTGPVFYVEDGYHPLLETPVANSFCFQNDGALCFLTGPNMSGKSTFLKSISLFVYLSHIGIPVPAKSFRTSIFNGLLTSINISDSIIQGHSHFYSEVQRIKEVAQELENNKHVMVVLDELFRGTNIKDAFDGTLMVIKSMSKIEGSCFLVSSHILEVAEELKESGNIDFKCFESVLYNGHPEYDYKLKEGITVERTGMQIIREEGIEEILKRVLTKQFSKP